MSHIHVHYWQPGCGSEVAIPSVRQIARSAEPSQLIHMSRKLTEFQSIGLIIVRAMMTRSQTHFCHPLRVFDARCQPRAAPFLHSGFPDLQTGHVHTSWNPPDIWISLFCENTDLFVHQGQNGRRLGHTVERIKTMDNPPEQAI
jgi:hypothetical protein